MIFKVLLLGFGLFIPIFTQAQEYSWKIYEVPEYIIEYPESWELRKKSTPHTTTLFLLSPSFDVDSIRENMNFLIQDISFFPMSLDEFVATSEKDFKASAHFQNLDILFSNRLHDNKREYHHIMYHATVSKKRYIFQQYVWIIDDSAYTLTFTSGAKSYENYQEIRGKIFESLQIKVN